MERAAAERKIAPTLVGFTTCSSTATREAVAHTCSRVGRGFLCMAQRIPLVMGKPVRFRRMSALAVYTGTPGHRAASGSASRSSRLSSARKDTGS